jgi:hypothetical protein
MRQACRRQRRLLELAALAPVREGSRERLRTWVLLRG